MQSYRVLFAALVTAALCALSVPSTASLGTNFTDQWWNPNESGWGASVLQQYDTLFIDLFVYASDGRPQWYTAAVYYQPQSGRALFSGDLYAAMGPWFGAIWNPAAFTARRVGTLQFDASSTDFATLTYSVDGVFVTKSIQRQLFTFEDFTGSYFGGFVYDRSNCANSANNGHVEELGSIQINHPANNTFTLTLQSNLGQCTIVGNYSQLGHMGTVDSNYSCTYGVNGTMTLYGLERTATGMTGQLVAENNSCSVAGRLGGVER